MLRYQFGPFIAYFHTFHTEDLLALTKTALQITRTSEEAMLWRGWAFLPAGGYQYRVKIFPRRVEDQPEFQSGYQRDNLRTEQLNHGDEQ